MERKQLIVYVDEDLHASITAWAAAEDRTLSAQIRKVLRGAVPAEYVRGVGAPPIPKGQKIGFPRQFPSKPA